MNRSDKATETLILILISLLIGVWVGLYLRDLLRPQPGAQSSPQPRNPAPDDTPPNGKPPTRQEWDAAPRTPDEYQREGKERTA